MRRPVLPLVLFTALLAQCARPCFGQTGRAELVGRVQDATGAVLLRAEVTIVEVETNQSYSTKSNSVGLYLFTLVRPGVYTVRAEAPDFQPFVQQGVQLVTGERIRLDITLRPGPVTESISVLADAPVLRTESASLGQVIDQRVVRNLPLKTRDFLSLVSLSAGVAAPPGSSFPRINGGRPRVNEYLYDGISVLQPEPGQVAFLPILDAIQEFKVETNSAPAEFGRFSGGIVNLSTRSGTNEFHGSVFEYFRNEVLNARNLFAPATAAEPGKPVFRRNQYGFVLGGPLARDRTFFFGDYQGTRQRIGRVRISTVPTLLQRQGVFTEPIAGIVPLIYDPATTTGLPGGGFTRRAFDGNRIPAERMDPVAVTLLARFPLPASGGTANNYRRVGNETQTQDQFDFRLDHRFSDGDQVFGRYSYARDLSEPAAPLPDGSGSVTTGALGSTRTLGQSVATSYTHVFTPQVISEIRFGYTRRAIDRRSLLLNSPASQTLGLPGIPASGAFERELPTFLISGLQQLGPPGNTDSDFRTDVTQVFGMISMHHEAHSLKLGGDLRFSRLDVVQPPQPTGVFRFTNLFTDLPGMPGTGSPLASFLLGQVQDFSIDLQSRPLRPRAMVREYFLQDDWKAAPRLAINAGVRYTLNFPSTEAADQGAVFNLETQQLDYLGRSGFPRSARKLHRANFGPRLGIAYQFARKTVIRSGYGLIWIDQAGITTPFTTPQFPFLQTVSQRTLDNVRPAVTLSHGPSVQPVPLTPDAGIGQGVFAADRDLGSGYAQHWNVAIQHAATENLSVEIAYAGSKGTHIGIPETNLNQLTAEQFGMGSRLLEPVANPFFGEVPASSSIGGPTISRAQLLKPFPRFTTVSLYRNNVGNTIYHSFQVKLEKRWSRGLELQLSYTRSKLIDEASSVFSASILTGPVENFPVADSYNRKLERDVSTGDIPSAIVASWVYELPVGAGHLLHPAGLLGRLASGWQLTGIVTMQTGLPVAVSQTTNFNAFAGFGTQRPNCGGDPEPHGFRQTTARFFHTEAFEAAPQFTLGSCSRNPVRGPGYRNVDLALSRRIEVNERIAADFRAEVYNLTNTPPLGNPAAVLGAAGFGSITTAGDPRVIQFALKLSF